MIDIKSLIYDELLEMMTDIGEPKFRAKQIFSWLHEKKVTSFEEMTNLSKGLREKLTQTCEIKHMKVVTVLTSESDTTKKYLFQLEDSQVIETVLMRYRYGYSICISSQVGCRMGCKFCASTLSGLDRNLSVSEMLEQVYAIERTEEEACHSVVVMGIGEPFDNYDNVINWIKVINDDRGRNLGQRHITVSTCGIVPKILEFADYGSQVNLAISLHAVNDDIRSSLMPVNNTYNIEALLKACHYYIKKTNRRITFEYTVIEGENESLEDARKLCKILRGMLCHVNLIPINISVNETLLNDKKYEKPSNNTVQSFKNVLEKAGVAVTVRRSLGDDIKASCGQLKHQHNREEGDV